MSYFPDFRKEIHKLNDEDKSAVCGFRIAVESVLNFFENLDDEDALSIEKEIHEKIKAQLEEWLACEEIEYVCSLFNAADYLPDDIELVDANKSI